MNKRNRGGRLQPPAVNAWPAPAPLRRPTRLVRALVAFVALLVPLLGLPVAILDLAGITHLSGLPALNTDGLSWSTLTARDAGTSASGEIFTLICLAIGALLWAWFAATTVIELLAAVRDRPRPHLPAGLSAMQLIVGPLVAAIVAVFLSSSLAYAGTPQSAAPRAAVSSVSTPMPTAAAATAVAQPAAAVGHVAPAANPKTAHTCTVERGDTLWSLAQHHLGDPLRWKEIAALNVGHWESDGQQMRDPNMLQPGWVLTLPGDAQTSNPPAHTARPAEPSTTHAPETARAPHAAAKQQKPVPAAHPAVAAAPTAVPPAVTALAPPATVVPAPVTGAGRVPPQLFRPLVPGAAAQAPTSRTPASIASAAPATAGASRTLPAASTNAAPPASDAAAPAAAPKETPVAAGSWEHTVTRVPFIGGGASLLAAGLLAELNRRRRAQRRRRRPNRLIRLPGPRHARTEFGLRAGADTPSVGYLDLALRSLAALVADRPATDLPDVLGAQLTPNGLVLHLSAPCTPPPPFLADSDTRWTLPRDAELALTPETGRGVLAPFPTLVTVGHDPALPADLTLLDLEAIGSISLHGDQLAIEGLLAWIAAELAHNAWSEWVSVTMCGFGQRLPALNTERLTYQPSLAEALTTCERHTREVDDALRGLEETTVLSGRLHGKAGDSWVPQLLLVGPEATATPEDLERLTRLAGTPGRGSGGPAFAVVAGVDLPTARWHLEIAENGNLDIGPLGLLVQAQHLEPDLVESLASLMETALDDADVAPEEAVTVRAEDPPSAPEDPAQLETAVVPALTPAATLLAFPTAPAAADPTLDRDLQDYQNPTSPRPRISILGSVELRTSNEQTGQRSPSVTEAAVMLALYRRVDEDRMIDWLWPGGAQRTTLTQNLSRLRSWLGLDDTGEPALPKLSRGARVYTMSPWILLDWDLFQRLRKRATTRMGNGDSRGATQDLHAALQLVGGPAFDGTPPEKYGWLANTGELHHIPAVIVDAAHVLADLYLETGDPEAAAWAAATAQKADGGVEETPWQDLMRAAHAAGDFASVRGYIAQLKATREVDVEEEFSRETYALIGRLLPNHYGARASG